MTAPFHPLGLETDGLPLGQALHLVEALRTVLGVLDGLQEQQRFRKDGSCNKAGDIMDWLSSAVAAELATLFDDIKARTVTTREEAENKFQAAVLYAAWGGFTPACHVAELTQLVAEMDIQVFRAEGRRLTETAGSMPR